MREDLVGGLRNALERGVPIEAAIQSFVTAGYKDTDVREAARDLDTGSVYIEQATKPAPNLLNRPATPVQPLVQRVQPKPQPQQFQPPKPQQGHGSVILVTVLAIILVLSVAAFIASILFREQIAAFFQ